MIFPPGRTGRSSSRGSSGERPPSTNMFIREGSLKAQKMENDAQKAELEDQERLKSEKRARSASKKVSVFLNYLSHLFFSG